MFEIGHDPEFLLVSQQEVYKKSSYLNPAKDGRPDSISNCILKDYLEFLVYPVTTILDDSFKQRLPTIKKLADVSRLVKKKSVKNLKKDLKPIYLIPCSSNAPEEFVVTEYEEPAALSAFVPSQYGAVARSCTHLALLEMLHIWFQGTDGM